MKTRVLLVEDDPADARVFRRYLEGSRRHRFALEHADGIEAALGWLRSQEFALVLLDLGLPDSSGLRTFCRAHQEAPDVPIIVLTGNDDEDLALRAVREGAQDYLVKPELSGPLLVRAIRYALERHAMQRSLLSLSLTDELTGLYNRRGFFTLAEPQLKLARRAGRRLSLVFADLDRLKRLNDTLGHATGNHALVEVAALLRSSFRDTDVVARLGGDEFAALLVEIRDDALSVPLDRLRENLARANAAPDRAYELSLSIGVATRKADDIATVEDLIDEADHAMYREKRGKKESSSQ